MDGLHYTLHDFPCIEAIYGDALREEFLVDHVFSLKQWMGRVLAFDF